MAPTWKSELRSQLIARRSGLGLTQAELAGKAGVVRNTVGKIEKGLALEEFYEAKIERALGWKTGSIDAIRGGGEPTLIETHRGDVNEEVEGFAHYLLGIEQRHGREMLFEAYNDLAEDEGDTVADAALRRYGQIRRGSTG